MKELPELPNNTILLVEVGSTAHGTGNSDTDDLDMIGIVVESVEQVLGLAPRFHNVMQRTQPEGVRSGPGDIDRTLYSLHNFTHLAAQGNPSILMCFWAPMIKITDYGHELQALGEYFVGRHIIPRYQGYMTQQVQRLLGTRGRGGHGKRGGGGREELISAHGYDTKYAMHCARLGYQCIELLTTEQLHLPIKGEPAEWLRAVRRGDIPFDEWWQETQRLFNALESFKNLDYIPAKPRLDLINKWLIDTYERVWHNEH